MDPVLGENPHRYVLFPIRHADVYSMYKKAKACFWTPEEVRLDQDVIDWQNLSGDAKQYILCVLGFFAASDGIVIENLVENCCKQVQMPEARAFYAFQAAMETIHSEMYSMLIETYVENEEDKMKLFHAVQHNVMVQRKADWALRWIKKARKFGSLLTAFAAVEGIMFSSSFAAIYWLKTQGVMPGLCFSNELIARDEGLHTDFAVMMFHKLNAENKPQAKTVRAILREAAELEKEFARASIPATLVELSGGKMEQYVEYVTNRLCVALGVSKLYKRSGSPVTNPFPWMVMISVDGKTNFFERRVGEYARAGVMTSAKERSFCLDATF